VLIERLQEILDRPGAHPHWSAALFIDLDQFKVLNDSKGHHVGDRLLAAVAAQVRAIINKDDIVARLGGDEFVVVMRDLAIVPEVAEQQVSRLAERLHAAIAEPVLLDGFPFRSTASIGIALFRSGGDIGVDEVLKRADAAMYEAKAAGTGATAFFAASMQAVLEERLVLTADLREAVEHGLLTVYYQPQVDDDGEVFGVEALLRWNHPQRGLIPPAIFIPLAERAGLGEQINAFVIGSACATLARWAAHPDLAKLQMAINVGGRRLGRDLVDIVTDGLALSGVDPERLTIELTEQVMLDNVAELDSAFAGLKRLGVKIFLDDFGTGYSSLSNLRRLPIDALKVDCSFVRDIETDQNDRVIVQTILNIARNLGLSVVAEGVENEMQGLLLRRFGCRAFQGFLYGKPMPLEEFEAYHTERVAEPRRAAVMAPSRLVV
jgi:diguanylate cyclase (GGDEF)-like protein